MCKNLHHFAWDENFLTTKSSQITVCICTCTQNDYSKLQHTYVAIETLFFHNALVAIDTVHTNTTGMYPIDGYN